MCSWFLAFLLKAFVSLVRRRLPILIDLYALAMQVDERAILMRGKGAAGISHELEKRSY
jgi:hypothetical protein